VSVVASSLSGTAKHRGGKPELSGSGQYRAAAVVPVVWQRRLEDGAAGCLYRLGRSNPGKKPFEAKPAVVISAASGVTFQPSENMPSMSLTPSTAFSRELLSSRHSIADNAFPRSFACLHAREVSGKYLNNYAGASIRPEMRKHIGTWFREKFREDLLETDFEDILEEGWHGTTFARTGPTGLLVIFP